LKPRQCNAIRISSGGHSPKYRLVSVSTVPASAIRPTHTSGVPFRRDADWLPSVVPAIAQGGPKDRLVCLRLACKRIKRSLDEPPTVRARETQ